MGDTYDSNQPLGEATFLVHYDIESREIIGATISGFFIDADRFASKVLAGWREDIEAERAGEKPVPPYDGSGFQEVITANCKAGFEVAV